MVKRRFLTGFLVVLAFLLPAGRCLADVTAQLAEAEAYVQQHEYEQAEGIYRQVATDNVGSAEGLSATEGLVLVLIRAEKKADSQAAYRQLMADYAADPTLVEVLSRQMASAFKDAKIFDTAAEIYEYILSCGPTAGQIMQCRTGLFKSYLGLDRDAEAQAQFDALVTDFADQANLADIVIDLAKECRPLRKWQACRMANEYFVNHWQGDERAANAQRLVAKSCLQAGDDEGANAAIEKLLADYNDNPGIGYEAAELADDYAEDRRYEEAAGLYNLAVERWPSSKWAAEAQKRLARMYIKIGDYEKADAAAAKLIESFYSAEGIAAAIEDVADMYQMAGSHAKSYPLHRYVVEHWPENERAIWCQMKAIMAKIRLEEYDAADSGMNELIEKFGSDERVSQCVHDIVGEYRGAGEHARAEQLYQYLLDRKAASENAELELRVGMVLSSMELDDEATTQSAIEKFVADFNDNENLNKGLFRIAEKYLSKARSSRRTESQQESRRYAAAAAAVWERIIAKWPGSDIARDSLYLAASGYELLGEYGQAKEYYETLVADWPKWERAPSAQYHVALCCHKSRSKGPGRIGIDDPIGETKAAVDKLVKDYPESDEVRAGMNLVGGPEAFNSANSEGEKK